MDLQLDQCLLELEAKLGDCGAGQNVLQYHMTIICVLSDTHDQHSRISIPKCDLLIHCGDFSNLGKYHELASFNNWIGALKGNGTIKKAVVIPGNHDLSLEKSFQNARENLSGRLICSNIL